MNQTVTMKFENHASPFQWTCSALEYPGHAGIGSTMAEALESWIDSLPTLLVSQREQIEDLKGRVDEARKQR